MIVYCVVLSDWLLTCAVMFYWTGRLRAGLLLLQ